MKTAIKDDFELVRGSKNVFRDLDIPNPDLEQLRAVLAAQIIKAMVARKMTGLEAQTLTGITEGRLFQDP